MDSAPAQEKRTSYEATDFSRLLGELSARGIPEETAFEDEEFEEYPLPESVQQFDAMNSDDLERLIVFRTH